MKQSEAESSTNPQDLVASPLPPGNSPEAHLAEKVQALEARLAQADRKIQELSYQAQLLQNVHDAIVGIDPEFTITYWNPAAETLYGWSAEQAIGRSLKNVLDCGLDGAQLAEVLRRLRDPSPAENDPIRLDLQQRGKNGRILEVEATAMAIRQPSGEILGYVAAVHDISDRQRLFEDLSKEKRLLQAVLNTAPAGIWITDENGKIIHKNRMVDEIWGEGAPSANQVGDYSAYQGRWAESGEPISAEDWALARAITRAETSTSEVIDIQRFDGQPGTILNSAAPIYDEKNQLIGAVAVAQDITAPRQAEEELRHTRNVLQAVLDTAPVGIVVTDSKGKFTLANAAAQALVGSPITGDAYQPLGGYTLCRLDGSPFLPHELPLPRALQDGKPVQGVEILVKQACGKEVILLAYSTPLPANKGKILGATAVLQDITERKRAEALLMERNLALHQSEQQMREIMESISDGFFSFDQNWRVIYINHVAAEQSGYHPHELIGQVIWDAIPSLQGSHVGAIYQQVMQERQMVSTEYRSQRSGRWFQLRVYPSTAGISIFSLDITKRKLTEQALQQSEAKLQARARELEAILDAVPAYMWITHDPLGQQIFGNPMLVELLQVKPGDNISRTGPGPEKMRQSKAMRNGVEIPDHELPVQKVAASGVPLRNYEFDMVLTNGEILHLLGNVSPLFDEHGKTAGAVSAFVDITPQKIYQRKLQENQNRFRVTLASAPISVYTVDVDLRITWMHDYHPGFQPETVLGLRLDQIMPNDSGQRLVAIQRSVLSTGQSQQGEIETWSAGQRSYYTYYVDPIRDAAGDITGLACAGYDVTQIKQTEQELERYTQELERSNQALQDFAFIASHDLQEPLRKIKLFGNNLRLRLCGSPDEMVEKYLDRMQNAAARMEAMIQGLLELSRINTQTRQFEPVNLTEIAQEVVSDLEARLHSSGGQVLVESLPVVEGDELQLRQLLQNLIGNALKFQHPGRAPVVRVWSESEARQGSWSGKAENIRLIVEDNGIGFDPRQAGQLFQPFIRLHGKSQYEGTGMGLAICRKIVERHGGAIAAESQPEKGSKFVVTLPAVCRANLA